MGLKLLHIDKCEGLKATERNNSLLAHGFQAITPGKDAQVLKALDLLEQLFRSESHASPDILKTAQFSWLLV